MSVAFAPRHRTRTRTQQMPSQLREPHPSVTELRDLADAVAISDPGIAMRLNARADVMEHGVPPALDSFDNVRM